MLDLICYVLASKCREGPWWGEGGRREGPWPGRGRAGGGGRREGPWWGKGGRREAHKPKNQGKEVCLGGGKGCLETDRCIYMYM